MTNFYTQNGWEGSNYKCGMRLTDIAANVRDYIKKEFTGMGLKFNVFTEQDTSLYVCLVEAPYEKIFTEEWTQKHPREASYETTCQHAHLEGVLIPELYAVFDKIQTFVLSYVRDDSNGMIDYFDRNFYDHYYVGNWKSDKMYRYVPLKEKAPQPEVNPINADSIKLIDYSARAVAVIGDTKPIKETLKKLGGKFNSRLTCGAGWIFSKKKESELKAALYL